PAIVTTDAFEISILYGSVEVRMAPSSAELVDAR
ncbi:MAG: hypothetical protein QOF01_1800, partial [Thermomicrobiales bacterium]|nr:hypothetical protein [Thermomicrobiales bacterium]